MKRDKGRKVDEKEELVNEVAKVLNTKKEARLAVDSLLNNISQALENKQNVRLAGFGTFKLVEKKPETVETPKQARLLKSKLRQRLNLFPEKT